MNFIRICTCLIALLTWVVSTQAHPIAEGTLKVRLEPTRLTLHFEVPLEQIAVANNLSETEAAQQLPRLISPHADYFLQHLSVVADGQTLLGQIQPQTNAISPSDKIKWLAYDFIYPLADLPDSTKKIVIQQTLLNGYTDAAGSPWSASYLATWEIPGQPTSLHLLTSQQPLEITLSAASLNTQKPSHIFLDYMLHGIWHILTGYDHMLFMAALVLAATTFWDLVKVVSAFTLAHTVTLTLSVLHIFRLQSSIVEPMIAASIIFVAVQNILSPQASRGWSRLGLAFGFGLFHGLGFAGGLLETMESLSGATVASALLAFSLGVELGHQCVVLPLFAALQIGKKTALTTSLISHFPHTPFVTARCSLP